MSTARVRQQRFEARRGGIIRRAELNEVRGAIASRKLDEAEPVAMGVEAQRLGIDGDARAEAQPGGQVALVQGHCV